MSDSKDNQSSGCCVCGTLIDSSSNVAASTTATGSSLLFPSTCVRCRETNKRSCIFASTPIIAAASAHSSSSLCLFSQPSRSPLHTEHSSDNIPNDSSSQATFNLMGELTLKGAMQYYACVEEKQKKVTVTTASRLVTPASDVTQATNYIASLK
ncbi:hypothetical protein BT96DRAFT_1026999 [Gymnopus androsaceus JB14]|uniref:Uncharacterized protein n=1 Tax=Gymnopus androsaceus JB14 TaxID=1447944 RepID=A0A6A4GEM5_9AGAR|nr:hypothetical protein BT96DRAFT_1026999 [Gymnopus androsaceus JB14]